MIKSLRLRFWIEAVMLVITAGLTVITMIWPRWIEEVFGVSPDHGDGSLEKLIVAGLLVATIALFFMTRYEWRAARSALQYKSSP